MAPSLLAIDIGSSHMRVFVFATDGAVLDERSCSTPIEAPGAGLAALDMDLLWVALCGLIRDIDARGTTIVGVGVTALLGNVFLDADRKPLGPALLWPDHRAVAEADELAALAGSAFAALSGRPMSAELAGARLKWLARQEPEIATHVRRVCSVKDYVVCLLTGNLVTDPSHAVYTGLFDVARRCWSPELARLTGIGLDLCPPLAPALGTAGGICEPAAAALALPAGTPVAVGAPDGTMGLIGAGGIRPGVTVDVSGTTDVLFHVLDRPDRRRARGTILNAHAIPDLWLMGGATGLTGGAVAWVAGLLGYASTAEAERVLLPDLSANCARMNLPLFHPTLAGSRFPDWRCDQRGLIAGLGQDHGPAEILAAAELGVAFTVDKGCKALRDCGIAVRELTVAGGLACRPAAIQLRADVLGLPLTTLQNPEASAAGCAVAAALVGGIFPDAETAVAALVHPSGRFEPDRARNRRFAEIASQWRAIDPARYPALGDATIVRDER